MVLLTGGTGVFGKFLIEDLLKNDTRIVLLIRAKSQNQAEDRAKKLLKVYPDFLHKIRVLKCDLTEDNLGLANKDYFDLVKNTTYVLHAAASTRFTLPLNEARRNNVETTRKLLNFSKKCNKLKRFGFISSAFVAGKRSGIILEDEFSHKYGFLNSYEESKYEAEMLVRTEVDNFPISIFRPSLIITPFDKSHNSPVNALTLGLFLARKGFLPILPGNKNDKLDIIKGPVASKAIIQIFFKKKVSYLVYHVTSFNNSPQIKDLISLVEVQSGKKLPVRFCGSIENFTKDLKRITHFRPDLSAIYKKTQSFLPELAYPKLYDNHHLMKELAITSFSSRPVKSLQSLLK